jgi:F-type H+-transporting ATPase subunit epsilon
LFSYIQYSQIAARVVRSSLKGEEKKLAAKRGEGLIKFKKWANGKPEGKEQKIRKETSNRKSRRAWQTLLR